MSDPSRNFETLLGTELPSHEDFDSVTVRPALVDTVISHLQRHRCCVIAGRPRTGKSMLSFCVARDIITGTVPGKGQVRYLDLATVEDTPERMEFFPATCFKREWLLLVDNWHARFECQEPLNDVINAHWDRGFAILYCMTRFPSREVAPNLPELDDVTAGHLPIVDTTECLGEVSKGMIDKRASEFQEPGKQSRLTDAVIVPAGSGGLGFPDDEDYVRALTAPATHLRIRGNLRFLRWRLQSWDPWKTRLRDVTVEDVLRDCEREIARWNKQFPGTIEKIAVVAQWEVPYRRVYGDNLPDGIEELERLNIVTPIIPGSVWRMDSTDAYLFLIASRREKWLEVTQHLLTDYIRSQRDTALVLVDTLLHQARSDSMTELTTSLLQDEETRAQVQRRVEEGLRSRSIGFKTVVQLVYAILRNFPDDSAEAKDRLEMVSSVLPARIGEAVGRSGRTTSINTLNWLLIFLRRDPDRFRDFVQQMLRGYDEAHLVEKINGYGSGKSQRAILRVMKDFEEPMAERIRSRIKLKPAEGRGRTFVRWLMSGTVETGARRQAKTDALAAIDEESLSDQITSHTRTIRVLQNLMHAAVWLSPDDARRLAHSVSQHLSGIEVTGGARAWSFLINNIHAADPPSGEDIVDLVRAQPFGSFFPGEPHRCSRLLTAMEKAQPGSVASWVAEHEESLANGLEQGYIPKLEHVLLPLVLFAEPSVSRVLERMSQRSILRLADSGVRFTDHIIRGTLSLGGVTIGEIPDGNTTCTIDTEQYPSIQLLAGLFDLNQEYNQRGRQEFARVCTESDILPPPVVHAMAKLQRQWDTEAFSVAVRRLLRGGTSERSRAIERTIFAAMQLGHIQWPVNQKFDGLMVGHRALVTCIADSILTLRSKGDSKLNQVVLCDSHPIVESVTRKILTVSESVGQQPITMSDWERIVGEKVPASEADTWRCRLIEWQVVKPRITVTRESFEVTFSRSTINRARVYEWFNLPVPNEWVESGSMSQDAKPRSIG